MAGVAATAWACGAPRAAAGEARTPRSATRKASREVRRRTSRSGCRAAGGVRLQAPDGVAEPHAIAGGHPDDPVDSSVVHERPVRRPEILDREAVVDLAEHRMPPGHVGI